MQLFLEQPSHPPPLPPYSAPANSARYTATKRALLFGSLSQMTNDSQQDIRDVLLRTVRIESDLYTLKGDMCNLKIASQTQHNALAQLQGAVQHVINLLQQPLTLAVPAVALQQAEGFAQQGAHIGKPQSSGMGSVPPNVNAEQPDTMSTDAQASSQEQHELCPFPNCPTAGAKCTALSSLRHMQTCLHCPNPYNRYLDILNQMCTFQKHPKVTCLQVCCWCAENFDPLQSTDSRSRHRSACRDKAKLCLEVLHVVLV